jgi:hypothetical protein
MRVVDRSGPTNNVTTHTSSSTTTTTTAATSTITTTMIIRHYVCSPLLAKTPVGLSPKSARRLAAQAIDRPPLSRAIRALWRLARNDRLLIYSAIFFLSSAALVELFIPQLTSQCLVQVARGVPWLELQKSVVQLAYIGTVAALLASIRGTAFSLLNNRLTFRMRSAIFRRILDQVGGRS